MKVVRLKSYTRAMKRMGIDEAALTAFERTLAAAPEANPMLQGLGGARKVRFARPGTGKSGGGRAIYYVVVGNGLLAMLAAYPKNEKSDLTSDDRKAIRRAIALIDSGDMS